MGTDGLDGLDNLDDKQLAQLLAQAQAKKKERASLVKQQQKEFLLSARPHLQQLARAQHAEQLAANHPDYTRRQKLLEQLAVLSKSPAVKVHTGAQKTKKRARSELAKVADDAKARNIPFVIPQALHKIRKVAKLVDDQTWNDHINAASEDPIMNDVAAGLDLATALSLPNTPPTRLGLNGPAPAPGAGDRPEVGCNICFCDYNSSDHHPQVITQCGHVICRECCTGSNWQCPFCRALFHQGQVLNIHF